MSARRGAPAAGRHAPAALALPVRVYACLTAVLAGIVFVVWGRVLPLRAGLHDPLPLAFLLLIAVAVLFPLQLGPRHKTTVGAAPEFAALLLFGPPLAMAVVGLAAASANLALRWRGKRGTWDVAFNTGQLALAVGIAGAALAQVARQPLPFRVRLDRPADVLAVVAAAVAMYAVNTGLVAGIVGLQRKRSPVKIWLAARQADAVQAAGLYTLGAAIALVVQVEPVLLVAFAAPLALVYQSLRLTQRSLQESERRRALELDLARAEKLRALGQLAAGVAHDVNNQLGAILSAAELLRVAVESGTGQRAELLEHLSLLERAARDSARTVRRLQLFSRRGDDEPPTRERVRLEDLIDDVLALTRPRWRDEAQAAGRHIVVRVTRGPSPTVGADPGELREALVNLVHNAVDAMPEGGVITLATGEGRADDGSLQAILSVRDAGVGMDEATKARMFEPFFTTKEPGKGTGLGLAMVHGIVERLHGSLAVESAPGAGATVTIRLPAAEPTDEAPAPRGQRVARITPRRVLVVEDEDGMRRIAVRLLERDGHACVAVATVDEALAALAALEERGGAFDLILTDVGLPGASGWQLAHHVARAAPNLRVVIATGWAAAVTDEQLAATGLSRAQVLAKPYVAADLRRAIDHLFPASPSPQEADAPTTAAGDAGSRERHPAVQAR